MGDFINSFLQALQRLTPLLATGAIFSALLWMVDRVLRGNRRLNRSEGQLSRQLIMLSISTVGVLLCILTLPVDDETQRDLLTVFGLILTAIITLSSTTFAANAMAGLMLRSMNHFRPGDFVRVDSQFGRVTERGLFHTEIQTEDRDLTSLPNLFLIQHPVTVVRASGTMVSALVSLGYEHSPEQIEPVLAQAATATGLEDPFVRIRELGNYSIEYRVAGFLADVKQLLTARSNLRREMIRALHGANIEIASPALRIERPMDAHQRILPARTLAIEETDPLSEAAAQTRVFDKAEKAARLEELKQLRQDLVARVKELEEQARQATEEDKPALEAELQRVRKRRDGLETVWETVEQRLRA